MWLCSMVLAALSLTEPAQLLERVRQASLPPDLAVQSIPREALRPLLEEALADAYGDRFDDYAALYRALRLLPAGLDAREALLALYQGQVAAFYNPKDHTMKVVEGFDPGSPMVKFLLVHELTHALQDRRLPLYAAMTARAGDRDASLALQSLLEGEAVLAMTLAALDGSDLAPSERERALDQALGMYGGDLAALVPDAPPFFVHDLLVPYQAGVRFVADAYRRGGWKAVDALYDPLPCCMEAVLHPGADARCPGLRGAAGSVAWPGRAPAVTDTLGETGFGYLLGTRLPPERARAAARGWDGDAAVLFRGPGGDAVAWLTRWDTPGDRREARDALRTWAAAEGVPLRDWGRRRAALFVLGAPGGPPPDAPRTILKRTEESDEHACEHP
jgi:hypothetical protein